MKRAVLPLLCALALLVVYALTMAPTLTWAHNGADGGDLVTAALLGRLPHPPGFPTYLLLARLFVRLPWGDPAWRLNLLSVLSAVLASRVSHIAYRVSHIAPRSSPLAYRISRIAHRLQSAICNPQSAIRNPQLATCNLQLAICLTPLLWSQALITEVYALAACCAALLLWLALRRGPAWAIGLVWGLAVGVHPTLLFLAPLVGWAAWQGAGRWRRLATAGSTALLTTALVYGPGLLLCSAAPSPWGDVTTLAGWWAYVSGQLYHGYLFSLPLAAYPARLWAWAGLLARQFTPLGLTLAGWGWWSLRRARPGLAWASLAAFGGFNLYALTYNTADSFVYLTAALPLAALWLAAGLEQAARWLGGRWKWLLFALPLLQLLLFWGTMDISADRSAVSWAAEVLEGAPPDAVLVTATDAHTFALWYTHEGLGWRPDVVVVDRDLWAQEHYRRMVCAALGTNAAEIETIAQQTRRPVIFVHEGHEGHE